jgi:hypothetical protein
VSAVVYWTLPISALRQASGQPFRPDTRAISKFVPSPDRLCYYDGLNYYYDGLQAECTLSSPRHASHASHAKFAVTNIAAHDLDARTHTSHAGRAPRAVIHFFDLIFIAFWASHPRARGVGDLVHCNSIVLCASSCCTLMLVAATSWCGLHVWGGVHPICRPS